MNEAQFLSRAPSAHAGGRPQALEGRGRRVPAGARRQASAVGRHGPLAGAEPGRRFGLGGCLNLSMLTGHHAPTSPA